MFRRSRSPPHAASLPHWDPLDPNYAYRRSKSDARFSRTRFDRRPHESPRAEESKRPRCRSRSPLIYGCHARPAKRSRRVSDPERDSRHSYSDEDGNCESPLPSSVDESAEEDVRDYKKEEIVGGPTHTASVGTQQLTVLPPVDESDDFAGFSSPAGNAGPSHGVQGVGECPVNHDEGLDPDLLSALGENPQAPPPPAPALHASIVDSWQHHITHGLPQDAFLALRESYVIPSNLPMIRPPKLNPEIAASVSNSHKTIDTGYVALQRQCSTAITALGMGLSKVMEQGGEAAATLGPSYRHMFDAGRAMTALFLRYQPH
uniref:Uncharacterized protein n=1 Tax=Lygus hesperus TaxID=30085 RepID=A0A146M7A5_LYGHE